MVSLACPMNPSSGPREATRLSELTSYQWRSGIAAWLGWLFDGMELHLYTLVATPLVIHLLALATAGASWWLPEGEDQSGSAM